MTLSVDGFIRRFLLHVLPRGFHRIRHYGLLAGAARKARPERARQLLGVAPPMPEAPGKPDDAIPMPMLRGRMAVIQAFERGRQPRAPSHGAATTGSSAPRPGVAHRHPAAQPARFRRRSCSRRVRRPPTRQHIRPLAPPDIMPQ